MEKIIFNKQTDKQKTSNDMARIQFIMAMMNFDLNMIIPLLNLDNKFLGYMNSWQLCNWLKKQFANMDPLMFQSKFKEGISLDNYPGSDVIEFSYAPIDNNFNDSLLYTEEKNEEAIFNCKNAVTIKLVLLFENGKIADMRIPKNVAYFEDKKKFQLEN